jgi:hypothetical protein
VDQDIEARVEKPELGEEVTQAIEFISFGSVLVSCLQNSTIFNQLLNGLELRDD